MDVYMDLYEFYIIFTCKNKNYLWWQFYESALTDHKNAFIFITKTHEKVHKNAWKKSTKTHRFKNRRCGSLAAIVTTTVHHKHQT